MKNKSIIIFLILSCIFISSCTETFNPDARQVMQNIENLYCYDTIDR